MRYVNDCPMAGQGEGRPQERKLLKPFSLVLGRWIILSFPFLALFSKQWGTPAPNPAYLGPHSSFYTTE